MGRWVGWGIVTHNLAKIAAKVRKRGRPGELGKGLIGTAAGSRGGCRIGISAPNTYLISHRKLELLTGLVSGSYRVARSRLRERVFAPRPVVSRLLQRSGRSPR